MKKLLSTTAFLGALALTAGSAEAANLQVNVGGFVDFQAAYIDDDRVGDDTPASAASDANRVNFNTDTEIHFTVEGVADNGLEYGAVIELEADVDNTDVAQNGGDESDKAYLFAQGGWGRVELGNNTDAAEALSVNSATFASGTGGVDGDFYRYAFAPASTSGFVVRPDLPIANAGNGAAINEDGTRVTYYTPRIAGFQGGVSYTPNSGDVGTAAVSGAGFQNVVSGGVNFTTQYDQFAIKLAAAAEIGDEKTDDAFGNEHLGSWEVGGNVSFAGFTVGGSYADLGQIITSTPAAGGLGIATAVVVDDANYWDAGVGYAFGPWSASATYFESEVDNLGATGDNEFTNLVIGTDYKLAPGLVPYAEVSFFEYEGVTGGAADNNDGTAVIVGTQLTF